MGGGAGKILVRGPNIPAKNVTEIAWLLDQALSFFLQCNDALTEAWVWFVLVQVVFRENKALLGGFGAYSPKKILKFEVQHMRSPSFSG